MKHLFLVVWSLFLSLHWVHSRVDERTTCRPVTASFCQGVGYTTTLHPNGVQGFNLQQIGQIVATACSPHVAALMCRVVVPECTSEDDSRMKPCRALCERVKTDCESALRVKGLIWPTRLRCEALPEANCVSMKQCQCLSANCNKIYLTEPIQVANEHINHLKTAATTILRPLQV